MTWENVPWMVGGGVEHSTRIVRLATWVGLQGREGIVLPGDLAVNAQATPNLTVRVAVGACGIINREAAGEAYAARLNTVDTVSIAATGGSARSDMVVARIENPHEDPAWPMPANTQAARQAYDYVRTAVISNVPATATTVGGLNLGYSAIPLARITLPANTSTVTQARITDLRGMIRATETWETAWVPQSSLNWPNAPGTLSGWYKQIGKTVHFRGTCTLTGAPGPSLGALLPVLPDYNSHGRGLLTVLGRAAAVRQGVGYYYGDVVLSHPTDQYVQIISGQGTAAALWGAGVPVVWAAGDILTIQGTYEAA